MTAIHGPQLRTMIVGDSPSPRAVAVDVEGAEGKMVG